MAMDRAQLILLGLPIFLFCSDLFNLFTPPPPKPPTHQAPPPHVPHHHHQRPAGFTPETLDFPFSQVQILFYVCLFVLFCFVISQYLLSPLWIDRCSNLQKKQSGLGGAVGYGNTVEINFCVSCSFKYLFDFLLLILIFMLHRLLLALQF